jgi:hypothetical protein
VSTSRSPKPKAVVEKVSVKRNPFIKLTGANKSANCDLEAKAPAQTLSVACWATLSDVSSGFGHRADWETGNSSRVDSKDGTVTRTPHVANALLTQ